MALFGEIPTPGAKTEYKRKTGRLESELQGLTAQYAGFHEVTRRFDRFPRALVYLHHLPLVIALWAWWEVRLLHWGIAETSAFWHGLCLLVPWLLGWGLVAIAGRPFFRRRVRWSARAKAPALALLVSPYAIAWYFWGNLPWVLWFPVGRLFEIAPPDAPAPRALVGLFDYPASYAYLWWALAAYGVWVLTAVFARKLYLASEVEEARYGQAATSKARELQTVRDAWGAKYVTAGSWIKAAAAVGVALVARELASDLLADADLGGAALADGTSVASGAEWATFSADGALVDVNADGVMDSTTWGTPVQWIAPYMRGDMLVGGHYRTIADGVLWNNLSARGGAQLG